MVVIIFNISTRTERFAELLLKVTTRRNFALENCPWLSDKISCTDFFLRVRLKWEFIYFKNYDVLDCDVSSFGFTTSHHSRFS